MSMPYFPLYLEDNYVYYDYNCSCYEGYNNSGDTIINGEYFIKNFHGIGFAGVRTNGNDSIWVLNTENTTGPREYFYEELSDHPLRDSAVVYQISFVQPPNESWQNYFDTLYRVAVDTTSGSYFNVPVRFKYIGYVDSMGNQYDRWYTDKFGLIKTYTNLNGPIDPNTDEEDLAYCKINGKEYGTNPISVNEKNAMPLNPAIISCYPNPTHDIAFIRVEGVVPGTDMHITITDILGKIVSSRNFYLGSNNNLTLFDGSKLPQGMYFVSVFNRDIHLAKKIFLTK